MRTILHYVHDAWPTQAGYTIRTHYIALNQRRMGYRVSICRWLGNYRGTEANALHDLQPCTENDGLMYFSYHPELSPRKWLYSTIRKLSEKRIRGMTRLRKKIDIPLYADWLAKNSFVPNIVHAHSPASTGLEAWRMARRFGAAFVYEVRGFWELSRAANNGERINIADALSEDVRVANKADRVVAICEGIAKQLIRNGVSAHKISIVPNGVDASTFYPLVRNRHLAKQLSLEGSLVYGYATNVRRLEGIQIVVQSWLHVKKRIPNAIFLLIGDGSYMSVIRRLAREYGVEDSWRFVGRIPHSKMQEYYSLFDVFVVPRLPEPVCEIVTPLKPLEAMAMGIPVVASGVSALREMVQDGKTGLLFEPGDPESLASVCVQIGMDSPLRRDLSVAARSWVERERDWAHITSRYSSIYQLLLK